MLTRTSVKSGVCQPFALVALRTTGSRLRWFLAGVKFSFACHIVIPFCWKLEASLTQGTVGLQALPHA